MTSITNYEQTQDPLQVTSELKDALPCGQLPSAMRIGRIVRDRIAAAGLADWIVYLEPWEGNWFVVLSDINNRMERFVKTLKEA